MIVCLSDLPKIKSQNKDKKIVLTIGTFDLFHAEHLYYLQDAKKLGDILVVAVKDNFLAKLKNNSRPIIDEKQRIEIIDNLKCVDYTVLCDKQNFLQTQKEQNFDFDEATNTWLNSFFTLCKNLQPTILYHENTAHLNPARNFVAQKFGIKLVERKRTASITTTKIINKIKSTK